jgi:molybdate transport system substrate-binding protein
VSGRHRPGALFATALGLLLLAGCGEAGSAGSASDGEVVVFAASSLKDAFEKLGAGLKDKGINTTFNFAGSQALAAQLAQGARADVFASADARNMEAAVSSGSVVNGTQRLLLTNKLVMVVAPGSAGQVSTIEDLARPGLKLVLADPSVPAGNYSLQVVEKLSADSGYGAEFKEKVLANVVSRENNVRQVVAKVQLGEADAGIVYATDAKAPSATPGAAELGTIEIPGRYNVIASYYIAPIKDAAHAQAAQRFVEYVLSDEGQRTLEEYGFGRADKGQ